MKIVGNKIGNVVNLFVNGNAYQKTFTEQSEANEFFKLMQSARTGNAEAEALLMKELTRKYKTVILNVLEKDADGKHYLKGLDIPMPDLLAETFLDYLENGFPITALENFWKLLVTNPDPRVRNDLFNFLKTYNFAITDNGYFIAYKAVEVKEQADNDLAVFVSNEYLKIKKWKKNPAHFDVVTFTKIEMVDQPNPDYDAEIEDDDEPAFIPVAKTVYVHKCVKCGVRNADNGEIYKEHGNLAELFKGIDQLVDKRSVYQSRHTDKNGNKVEQVLGEPVRMARIDTDRDPKVECSAGYHVGSVPYVKRFAGQDDAILLVLVNPAHVVAVPDFENTKMRTAEYFPYAVLDRKDSVNGEVEFEVIEEIPYFEEDYMKYEKDDLEKEVARIQAEIEAALNPTREQLDYKKILQDRLVVLEDVLAEA